MCKKQYAQKLKSIRNKLVNNLNDLEKIYNTNKTDLFFVPYANETKLSIKQSKYAIDNITCVIN